MIESLIIPLIYPVFIMFVCMFVFEHFMQAFIFVLDSIEGVLHG